MTKYPEQYLHVLHCRSGQTWIEPIRGSTRLNLTKILKRWIKKEFCGELQLDGMLQPRLEGEYYAKIMTDGRPPKSIIVWESGGFWLKSTYE